MLLQPGLQLSAGPARLTCNCKGGEERDHSVMVWLTSDIAGFRSGPTEQTEIMNKVGVMESQAPKKPPLLMLIARRRLNVANGGPDA